MKYSLHSRTEDETALCIRSAAMQMFCSWNRCECVSDRISV